MKKLRQSQVIDMLRKRQGARPAMALATELGISKSYLSEIFKGTREPGPAVLAKLRLKREIVYTAQ